jgi:hypothetical protein
MRVYFLHVDKRMYKWYRSHMRLQRWGEIYKQKKIAMNYDTVVTSVLTFESLRVVPSIKA